MDAAPGLIGCFVAAALPASEALNVLVEAEGFAAKGGKLVDSQFEQQMGSPFLVAHGGGRPVASNSTLVTFPEWGQFVAGVRLDESDHTNRTTSLTPQLERGSFRDAAPFSEAPSRFIRIRTRAQTYFLRILTQN
jgi:hypothetical protein